MSGNGIFILKCSLICSYILFWITTYKLLLLLDKQITRKWTCGLKDQDKTSAHSTGKKADTSDVSNDEVTLIPYPC